MAISHRPQKLSGIHSVLARPGVCFALAASILLAPFFVTQALATEKKQSLPTVKVTTSEGEILIRLRPDVAPKTVKNFLTYAKADQYQGTIFHRVIDGFMIQGGGYNSDLKKISTRAPIPNEASQTLPNIRGSVAMARTRNPDSATSQFFVNLADNAFLNKGVRGAGYTVFGTVTEGMGVVDAIANIPTAPHGAMQNLPKTDVVIKNVSPVKQKSPSNP